MTTVFAVFALGLMVSLVIAKGMMQANDYARQELKKQKLTMLDKVVED
ncbi:MAG: hypothetical protein WED15_03185 [Akkermansiaceae bacterium]